MTPEHSVQFTSGSPETVLDPLAPELAAALDAARSLPPDRRREAVAAVAARDPRCLQAWADLAELADDPIDATPSPGSATTAGSTRCGRPAGAARATCAGATSPTEASCARCTPSERAAAAIGEIDEEQRCALFLRQLDPEWGDAPA